MTQSYKKLQKFQKKIVKILHNYQILTKNKETFNEVVDMRNESV